MTHMGFPRKDTERRSSRLGPQFQFQISEYDSKCKICVAETENYIRETTNLLALLATPNYFSVRFRNLNENANSKLSLSQI